MKSPCFGIVFEYLAMEPSVWVEDGLAQLVPVLHYYLRRQYSGWPFDAKLKAQMIYNIGNFIERLINAGLIRKNYQNQWEVDIVGFVEGNVLSSYHYSSFFAQESMYYPLDILAQCLMDECNLCAQMKKQPAEKITRLAERLNDDKLYEAVERYKDEIILQVAGI